MQFLKFIWEREREREREQIDIFERDEENDQTNWKKQRY